jgi:hypothetical protein
MKKRMLKLSMVRSFLLQSELIFFALIVIFLPINLGFHFPQSFSYVYGYLVNYYIPTLYLTDVFLLILLLLWTLELLTDSISRSTLNAVTKQREFLVLGVILIGLLPNVSVTNSPASWLGWLLWLKASIFLLWIASHHLTQHIRLFLSALSLGVLIQSIIALGQFLTQSSLGSYWLLGETDLSQSIGIAKGVLLEQSFIRGYGTTPHPNVLAGYLAVSLLFFFFAFKQTNTRSNRLWLSVVIIFGILALVSTMSRGALLSGVGALLILWLIKNSGGFQKIAQALLLLTGVGTILLFLTGGWEVFNSPSVTDRLSLAQTSFTMMRESPIGGVGLNNFISESQKYTNWQGIYRSLQPVHSIYLLLAVEGGVFISIVFSGLLIRTVFRLFQKRELPWYRLSSGVGLMALMLIGLGDHYLLSIHQGMLLLFLWLGLSSSL